MLRRFIIILLSASIFVTGCSKEKSLIELENIKYDSSKTDSSLDHDMTWYASIYNPFQLIKTIKKNGNINAKDGNGASVFMWAVYTGNIKTIKMLKELGADTSAMGIIWIDQDKGSFYGSPLCVAAGLKDTNVTDSFMILKYLVEDCRLDINEREYNIKTKKYDGWTALMGAAYNGHEKKVKYLLSKGADPNIKDEYGNTALHYAALANNEEIIKQLISKGANINEKNNDGNTPLHIAVINGQAKSIRTLVKFKADLNARNNASESISDLFKKGISDNPIYWYLVLDDDQKFSGLLKEWGDINRTGIMNSPLISLAALCGSENVIKILVKNGADVNIRTGNGATPLHSAITSKSYNAAEYLIKMGADVNAMDQSGITPLHTAIENNDYKAVKLLIKNNANPVLKAENNAAPWEMLDFAGHEAGDIIEILLKKGVNPNSKCSYGDDTFFSRIVWYNYTDQAILAVKYGADINYSTERDPNLLYYTVKNNNYELTEYFIKKGLPISEGNDKHSSLIVHALNNPWPGQLRIIELLVNNGADVNTIDPAYKEYILRSAFGSAIRYGQENIVRFMISKGAYINQEWDVTGQKKTVRITPLITAMMFEQYQIAEFLVDNGADVNYSPKGSPLPVVILSAGRFNRPSLLTRMISHGLKLDTMLLTRGSAEKGIFIDSILGYAIFKGYFDTAKDIISRGGKLTDLDITFFKAIRRDPAKYLDFFKNKMPIEYKTMVPTYADIQKIGTFLDENPGIMK